MIAEMRRGPVDLMTLHNFLPERADLAFALEHDPYGADLLLELAALEKVEHHDAASDAAMRRLAALRPNFSRLAELQRDKPGS